MNQCKFKKKITPCCMFFCISIHISFNIRLRKKMCWENHFNFILMYTLYRTATTRQLNRYYIEHFFFENVFWKQITTYTILDVSQYNIFLLSILEFVFCELKFVSHLHLIAYTYKYIIWRNLWYSVLYGFKRKLIKSINFTRI